ncbi:MAG: acetyl-CoA carboxylase carboxyltransferase subunit beta [Candidatus Calescibacterium sp.]|nr:acetyl-CoA carboxylase carboxyl transferase subunit beta [Candidatus Calescibacterium sp.]MDW8133246.1 acetyl-CoA carboxylase carboxyltransferase subunit beta [Candidatus Calescibacterium sp.]
MLNEWIKCESCGSIINRSDLEENLWICPKCGRHFYIGSKKRIDMYFCDFKEMYTMIKPLDFLNFEDYSEKLKKDSERIGIDDAIIVGIGYLKQDLEKSCLIGVGVMDFGFRGGSMGSVVGQKISLISEYCYENEIPLVIFSASGGARMQEGIISLMQMAKTVGVINKLKKKRIPFINVVTNPTTGGVAASFVGIADIIVSEPGAIIGFAGQRVIEQTIKKKLPPNFQTAEFNLQNGLIDQIVDRKKMGDFIYRFVSSFYYWKRYSVGL